MFSSVLTILRHAHRLPQAAEGPSTMGDCPSGSLHVTCHPEGWECVETEGSPRRGAVGGDWSLCCRVHPGQSPQPRRPQNQDGDRRAHVCPIPAPHINATMVGTGWRAHRPVSGPRPCHPWGKSDTRVPRGGSSRCLSSLWGLCPSGLFLPPGGAAHLGRLRSSCPHVHASSAGRPFWGTEKPEVP